jgi:hypothetical protein
MRNQSRVRAGIKVAGGAFAGPGLVKVLAYYRANRAPAPGTLPDPPPPPGVRPDGTPDPDMGVGKVYCIEDPSGPGLRPVRSGGSFLEVRAVMCRGRAGFDLDLVHRPSVWSDR